MERKVGTISMGIRCPIIRQGDDLAKIVADSVLDAAQSEGFSLRDRDVISITESIVARSQGNYASVDAIAKDVQKNWAVGLSVSFSRFYPVIVLPFACAGSPKVPKRLF